MFTGIIEEIGYVKSFNSVSGGAKLEVCCSDVLSDLKIGDSICINGVCETVTSVNKSGFCVDISEETLSVTNFMVLAQNDKLNLERALTLNSRLGGHIVSGHVDCKGVISSIDKLSDFYNISVMIPPEFIKYVVYKGSIAVNGISLTVSEINGCRFTVAVIPHTYQNTNLHCLNIGKNVNIETDILGRYVEKMMLLNDNKNDTRINMEFLQENGFV
ncbi:riboflavin synthase [bacterium]|nr:riboflavin synthase [bacterium]